MLVENNRNVSQAIRHLIEGSAGEVIVTENAEVALEDNRRH